MSHFVTLGEVDAAQPCDLFYNLGAVVTSLLELKGCKALSISQFYERLELFTRHLRRCLINKYGKELIDRARVDQASELRDDKSTRRVVKIKALVATNLLLSPVYFLIRTAQGS
ncbi:MAG: hypothetical protein ABGY95_03395 [Rubritalea sp.]|uniref:hypothetical protein n=1 Tax=Rubritalea sp. TaxID=2109375 RepID=UPI003242190E